MSDNKNSEARKWLIHLVKDRYEWLSLTEGQAEAIHEYEERIEKVHSDKFIPSFWEEKETESYFFKQILSERQFEVYSETTLKQITDAEMQMVESDKAVAIEVEYNTKLLSFYRDDLVPKLIQHKNENLIERQPGTKRRIDFLKNEYAEYLKVRWKEVCVAHFRYARNFQPNQFKLELLHHEMEKVYPSYYFFEKASDSVIYETGRFIFNKMAYEYSLFSDFMKKIGKSSKEATEKLYQQYHPEKPTGFTAVIELGGERPELQKQQDEFLSYLLVDPEKYG